MIPLETSEVVASHIAGAAVHDVVPAVLHSRTVLMALELDITEHARRLERSVGPLRSRGLLHALWTLPEGLAWPTSGLDPLDVLTLEREGDGFVVMDEDAVIRVYRPAGRVRAIGLVGGRLPDVVATASRFPPIFRRYAVAAKAASTDPQVVAAARTVGIGAAIAGPNGLRVLGEAEPAQVGVPGVYRWWLAEVAYRSWLQTNAH